MPNLLYMYANNTRGHQANSDRGSFNWRPLKTILAGWCFTAALAYIMYDGAAQYDAITDQHNFEALDGPVGIASWVSIVGFVGSLLGAGLREYCIETDSRNINSSRFFVVESELTQQAAYQSLDDNIMNDSHVQPGSNV